MSRDLRLRVLFEALDKVTQPLREIAGGSSQASKALRDTQTKLQALNRAQGDVSAFRKLKQEVGGTEQALKEAQARVAALARQMQATDAPTKKLRTEFERAKRSAASLKTEHQAQGRQLQQLRERLSAAGIPTNRLAEHERRLRQEVSQANDALQEQTRRLDAVADRSRRLAAGREAFGNVQNVAGQTALAGAAAIGGGMAVAAPMAGATREAMTFESAMADVKKVVDFPTPEAFETMSDDVLDLSTRIPMAADGLAQIVAAAGRAGIAREELLGFAADAAKMGIAFETTAEDAGEMMAKWRTAFSLSQAEVVGLADQINALTNAGGGNVQAITEMVTRIGALGKVVGLSAADLASMGQLINEVGVEAEVGATGLKNMTLALTRGASATKSQKEALKALGLSAEGVAKSMQMDGAGTVVKVMERLAQLAPELQAATIADLFGTESIAAISPLITNLDKLRGNLRLVGDASQYAGSMEKEYLTRIATTEGVVGLARNAFDALNVSLGKRLLPTVVDFAQKGGALLNRMRAWANENPRLVKGMLLIAGILSAVMIGFGGLALAITALLAPFAALAFIAGVFNIAMLPMIGIVLGVIAGIAALSAAALYLYNNWDRISAWWRELWGEIYSGFTTGIGGIITTLVNFSPYGLLYAGFAKLLDWLGIDIPDRLFDAGVAVAQGLWNGIWSAKDWLVGKLKQFAELIPAPIRRALGIKSPSRVFMGIGGDIMDGLDEGLEANARNPVSRVRGLSGQLTRAMAVGITAPALLAANPAAASSDQLAQALERGTPAPPQRAVSAPPAATAVAAPVRATAAAASPASGNTYNLTINVTSSNPADVERAVRSAIERIERDRSGRTFSDNR